MNRERVAELFEQAVELPDEARGDWLDSACSADTALRAEVERLLRADARAAWFMERPPALVAAAIDASIHAGEDLPQFGAWRTLRRIGIGGMGEVWLAERADGEFEQRVAIKQLAYPTPGLMQRFRQERQILARLEHPNIARLIDGGVTDGGSPYLVMDYVDGIPITQYVRERHLGLRASLHLFLQVCSAVQYAHQNLVIHRDLKPSNILVTADGSPKLLDFGIAKVLATTDGAAETQTAARMLTPDYAAPEQFSGGVITTATDVYALGVVLYELLAGTRPHRPQPNLAHPREPQHMEDVTLPSAVVDRTSSDGGARRRALRGDLDRIALMALAADPQRRYPSIEAFAADLQRYLEGRPITAQPGSRWYRLRKFSRRNRYPLAAGMLILGILVAATAISLHQARLASEQALRAVAVRRFFVDTFAQIGPDENHGQPITAKQLLQRGERRLSESTMPVDVRADLTALVGTFYWNLADNVSAERLQNSAVALADEGRVPDAVTARSLIALARAEQDRQDYASAYAHAERALSLAPHAGAEGVELDRVARRVLAGLAVWHYGLARAESIIRNLLAEDRASQGEYSDTVLTDLGILGEVLDQLSRYDDAESIYQTALANARAVHGPYYSLIALNLVRLGGTRSRRGDYVGAEIAMRDCLAVVNRLWGEDNVRSTIVRSHVTRLDALQGHMARALPILLTSVEEARMQRDARPDHFADTIEALGTTYYGLGRLAEADVAYREAIAAREAMPGGRESKEIVSALGGHAATLVLQGRYSEAEDSYRRAIAIQETLNASISHAMNANLAALGNLLRLDHRPTDALHEINRADFAFGYDLGVQDPASAIVKAQLSEAQLDAGDAVLAQITATQALTMAKSVLPQGNWQLGTPLFALARAELALAHAAAAEVLLREALAVRSPLHPAGDPRILEVQVALVSALRAQGKIASADALGKEIAPQLLALATPYADDLRQRQALN